METSLRWLTLALMAIALFSGEATAQTKASEPPYPAPGRLIDIGGWRLHLNCTGESRQGQATVVLEAGVGAFSVDWSLVQPGVSALARVCSYDRAGTGWSEWGPHPRTLRQIVYELHALLERAGERPPFVLVGASYGGWLARVYQMTYPAEVAGIVLVDAGANDPWRLLPDGQLVRSSQMVTGRPIPEVQTAGPLRESDIPPEAMRQIRAGLASLSAGANSPPRDKLPPEARAMRSWVSTQVGHIVAAVNPFEHEELAELREYSTAREYPLDDLPLVVLTRGVAEEQGSEALAREEEHRKDQALMAAMSRRGKQVIAAQSGHHVQIDQPDLVIRAIEEVLTAARKRRPVPLVLPWDQLTLSAGRS